MNTGNYIYDYIYELTEDKYIIKEEAMMFTEGFYKKKRLSDEEYKRLILLIEITYQE